MGWVIIGNEFYGDLPASDPNKSETENEVAKRRAMKEQIEKSHPGFVDYGEPNEHS